MIKAEINIGGIESHTITADAQTVAKLLNCYFERFITEGNEFTESEVHSFVVNDAANFTRISDLYIVFFYYVQG